MKTIDINLIRNIEKASEKTKRSSKKEDILDPKLKVIAVTILVGTCLVFLLCDGIWFFAFHSTKKANSEIKDLKAKQENLLKQITESNVVLKELQSRKKILEIKLLAQNQVQNSLLPWQNIMNDVANAVPKNVKITDISKDDRSSDESILSIDGEIGSLKNSKNNPLETISFFALNLSGIPGSASTLSDAVIKKIEYKKETGIYEFKIEAKINLSGQDLAKQNDQKKAG